MILLMVGKGGVSYGTKPSANEAIPRTVYSGCMRNSAQKKREIAPVSAHEV